MTITYYMENKRIVAGMTKRNESYPEDNNMALHATNNKRAVIENRTEFATALEVYLDQLVFANQIHGDNFYRVTKNDGGRGTLSLHDAIPNTDALYTFEKEIVLCSLTADCVPVFFENKSLGVIGIIHSGWQGTALEITRKVLNHIATEYEGAFDQFTIQIGSAISKQRFEVDRDVNERFATHSYSQPFIEYDPKTEKYTIDLQLIIKEQCKKCGVPEEQIKIDRTCTYDSATGFSYREQTDTGRHLNFIMQW